MIKDRTERKAMFSSPLQLLVLYSMTADAITVLESLLGRSSIMQSASDGQESDHNMVRKQYN